MFDNNNDTGKFKRFKDTIVATWKAYFPNSQPTSFLFSRRPKRNTISLYSLVSKKMDPLKWSIDNKVYFDIDRNIFIKI